MASSSEISPIGGRTQDPEAVHSDERSPAQKNYHEKDGLRTYGDDADHDHEPPVSLETESRERSRSELIPNR